MSAVRLREASARCVRAMRRGVCFSVLLQYARGFY